MRPFMKAFIGLAGWGVVGLYGPTWLFVLYLIVFMRYFQDFVLPYNKK